jgi:2-keto-myo-inositol isomerase
MMKTGYNGATAMKYSSLEKDLELTERFGYDYIEIRLSMLEEYLKSHSLGDLKDFFASSHVQPFSINAIEYINFRDEAGLEDLRKETAALCEIAREIGAPYIVAVPTFGMNEPERYSWEEIREDTARALDILGGVAQSFGVGIAFEPIGLRDCAVRSIRQGWEIVRDVDRENVGLALDVFNLYVYDGFKDIEDLSLIGKDKIFLVHIDDCENRPIEELDHCHRLMPGDGIIDMGRFFTLLFEKGFDQMVSIELFHPKYWEMPVEEVIEMGREKTLAVIEKAFMGEGTAEHLKTH